MDALAGSDVRASHPNCDHGGKSERYRHELFTSEFQWGLPEQPYTFGHHVSARLRHINSDSIRRLCVCGQRQRPLSPEVRIRNHQLLNGTSLAALPTTDSWLALDANDDVLGAPPAGSTGAAADLVLRKANGSVVPIPIAPTAGVARLAPNGTVVAEVGTTWMIWRGGTAQPVADLLPPGSDWTIGGVLALSSNYLVGQGQHQGQTHDFLLSLGQSFEVSGHVLGRQCRPGAVCQQKGLASVTVSVGGTASDGSSVSTSDLSASDGSWSVQVPSGAYTVTPRGDGWSPRSLHESVRADVSGANFVKCVTPSAGGAAQDDGTSRISGGGSRHAGRGQS